MRKPTLARIALLSLFLVAQVISKAADPKTREFYQITIYHFTTTAQEQSLDEYLHQAYIPALHRQGISKVGVFKAISNDTATDKTLYVLAPLASLELITRLPQKLEADQKYLAAARTYLEATYNAPPYSRIETIVLQAFPDAPVFQLPSLKGPTADRVYELRSYESATEKIFQNKVKMFNAGGEVALFKRLNFNAVFYAEVLAGHHMPNLMYMTSFENMADRDAHWKTFVDDPFWKKLSALPEYQNNVSHIDITFLHPTPYSEL